MIIIIMEIFKHPIRIIYVVIFLIFVNCTDGETDNFQGLWFDAGIDIHPDSAKDRSLKVNDWLFSFKDGFVYNLATRLSQNSGLMFLSNNSNVDFSCLNDTEKLIMDLKSRQLYALRFFDADGKLPPGFLQGSWNWVGDYQECNSIESSFNIFTNHNFSGKYISVVLYHNFKPLNGNVWTDDWCMSAGFLQYFRCSCFSGSCILAII